MWPISRGGSARARLPESSYGVLLRFDAILKAPRDQETISAPELPTAAVQDKGVDDPVCAKTVRRSIM
jgi:hypothetical protein